MWAGILDNTHRRKRRNARRRRTINNQLQRFNAVLPRFLLVPQAQRRRFSLRNWHWSNWRLPQVKLHWGWLIGVLLLAASVYGVYFTQSDERWFIYREDVSFENLGYLEADQLYELTAVDSWNVFWLNKEEVRDRLRQHPFVVDAQVTVDWPAHVTIRMLPAQPVAIWMRQGVAWWLMPNGYARPVSGALDSDLPQLIDPLAEANTVVDDDYQRVAPEVLTTLQSLVQRLPDLTGVRYTKEVGINFSLPELGYYIYWGDGFNFERKLSNLEAGRQLVTAGTAWGTVIDVRNLDRPYVR